MVSLDYQTTLCPVQAYVNLDEHVRAVYSICVLAYFLNKDIADSRKKIEGIDYLNSKNHPAMELLINARKKIAMLQPVPSG